MGKNCKNKFTRMTDLMAERINRIGIERAREGTTVPIKNLNRLQPILLQVYELAIRRALEAEAARKSNVPEETGKDGVEG